MTSDQQIAVLVISLFGTTALLLLASKRYRKECMKAMRLETNTFRMAIEFKLFTLIHLGSFFLPLYLMGLL